MKWFLLENLWKWQSGQKWIQSDENLFSEHTLKHIWISNHSHSCVWSESLLCVNPILQLHKCFFFLLSLDRGFPEFPVTVRLNHCFISVLLFSCRDRFSENNSSGVLFLSVRWIRCQIRHPGGERGECLRHRQTDRERTVLGWALLHNGSCIKAIKRKTQMCI